MESLGTDSISLILITVLAVVSLVLTIIALIDIVRSDFKKPNDKLTWLLVTILCGLLGSILYFTVGTKHKVNKLT